MLPEQPQYLIDQLMGCYKQYRLINFEKGGGNASISFVVADVKGFVFNQTLQYLDSTRTALYDKPSSSKTMNKKN